MTEITQLIVAICAGLTLFGSVGWYIVSSAIGLKSKMTANSVAIESLRKEIGDIHSLCHSRELWMKTIGDTTIRTDKNVVKIAAKLDINIEA